MKKLYLLSFLLSLSCISVYSQLSVGDIAFVGYNCDNDEDAAFVTFVDIPASTEIYIADFNLNGTGGFDRDNNGFVLWNSGVSIVNAGTVVVFSDINENATTTSVSVGSVSVPDHGTRLVPGGDHLYAYIGTDELTPTTFLAALEYSAGEFDLTGTGLTAGSTAITVDDGGGNPDGGIYSGSRTSESAMIDYRALIANPANWTHDDTGDNLLPYSTASFAVVAGAQVGFDNTSEEVTETNSSFTYDIPVTLSDYAGSSVDLSVSASLVTAESGDFTLNTTSLSFSASETQNISVTINPDADDDLETFTLMLAETTSTGVTIVTSSIDISIDDDDALNIVISEIMANGLGTDADTEFIELYNAEATSINLDGYSITEPFSFSFTASDILLAGEYMILARNAATYSGNGYDVVEFTGSLLNTGATITLANPSGATVDQVTYDNLLPSANDDDRGHSYTLSILGADNSDMTYWTSSSSQGGTPGAANDVTVWTGATSAAFDDAGNWSNGLPSASVSAFVEDMSSNQPAISTAIELSTIKILPLSTLAIGSGSLQVNNDFHNEGTVTIASEASLLPLYSLRVRNDGAVVVNRNTTFSTTAGKYSVIGSPVESATTSDLGSIVYGYDETVAYAANGNDRFIEVTSAETIDPGDAYFSANTGAISFTGTPNSGTVSQTLVYDEVADGGAANAGFNLVSNPYTAAINVDLLVAENSDMSASIYLWQDESSNTTQGSNDDYVVYNSTDNLSTRTTAGGRTFDGYLRSTQGFFVKATAASTLNFTTSMMSTGNNDDAGYFRKNKEATNYLRLSLNQGAAYSDMIITLRENATLGIDRLYDAYSLSGAAMKLYSYIGEERFAFQGLPLTGEEIMVDLGFDIQEDGIYELNLEESLFDEYHVLLVDTELNKTISLTEDRKYTFTAVQARDSKRFQLVLRTAGVLSSEDIDETNFNVFTDAANLNVRTLEAYDEVNIQVFTLNGSIVLEARDVDLNSKSWTVPFDRNGLYILAIETKDGLLVKKFLK